MTFKTKTMMRLAVFSAITAFTTLSYLKDTRAEGWKVRIGMDMGVARPQSGGDFFSHGFGSAYVLGIQKGAWELHWRLGESYDLQMSEELGAVVDGEFSIHSMGVGRSLLNKGSWNISGYGGIAMLENSVALVNAGGPVETESIHGLALYLGSEISYSIAKELEWTTTFRAYIPTWENFSGPAISKIDGEMYESALKSEDSFPISLSLGLRIRL